MPIGSFTDSTPLTPLRDPFNVLVTGINAVESTVTNTRQIQTFRWANQAARTAQTGMQAGDFGFQIDTGVLYQYSGSAWNPSSPGLVRLRPTSVSNATINANGSVSVSAQTNFQMNGIFSSTFSNYILKANLSASSNSTLTAQLCASGTANSSSLYYTDQTTPTSATTVGRVVTSAQSSAVNMGAVAQRFGLTMEVFNPADAERTLVGVEARGFIPGSGPNSSKVDWFHDSVTLFDGIKFTSFNAATWTGTFRVYGMV